MHAGLRSAAMRRGYGWLGLVLVLGGVAGAQVTGLRCEYLVDPVGLDVAQPRLSWLLASRERGARQTAYQVLVAATPELLAAGRGDRWDSGKVASNQSTQVVYAGTPLAARQRCWWQVRVWDQQDRPTPWSTPARWSMGLLAPGDWRAQWVGAGPAQPAAAALELGDTTWVWYPEASVGPGGEVPAGQRFFRRVVRCPESLRRARAVLTCDDQFTLWVNDQQVGKSDGNTDAWRRPTRCDLTPYLRAGDNVLAVVAVNQNNGNLPTPGGLAARLVLEAADGQTTEVRSDATWKVADKQQPGWRTATFDDSAWPAAKVLGKVGGQPWGGRFEYPQSTSVRPSPLLRKVFTVARPVRAAQVSVCGLGYHELHLDGAKVGDSVLEPAITQYDKRALYVTHDLTDRLTPGRHAFGVQLANGVYNQWVSDAWSFHRAPWLAPPALLLQLDLEYADGGREQVVSDETWRLATGPVTFDLLRVGVSYDARLERPGWATATYDDREWQPAQLVPGPKGVLAAQRSEPVKVMRTLPAKSVKEVKPGVLVYDLDQNMTGWARLTISGPAGTTVKLRYGERLRGDGTVDQANIASLVHNPQFQTDQYTLRGAGEEVFEPRFAFHGFQWVELTGLPAGAPPPKVEGRVVHTAFAPAGGFECSHDLLNRIERNSLWSFVGNFVGYPTDCPHREKNGWTGDAQLAAEMGLLHYRVEAAYTRWLDDLRDAQRPDGKLPCIVPTGGWGYNTLDGPAWESAYPLIAWWLYEYRGDRRILETHYEGMRRLVDFYARLAKDGICRYGLGDWCPAKTKTPAELTSTGYLYADALVVARAAALLGKADDATKYHQLAASVREAFNRTWYKPGTYANGSQTALSCALYHGLVEPANRAGVLATLVDSVTKAGDHLDVGILGSKYLLRALCDGGRADVAWRIVTQRTHPSWGRWLEQGATTLWEDWHGGSSRNHIMFGDISAWFIEYLAGIRPDPEAPGFQRFIVRPAPVAGLDWARATHDSPYGTIVSAWKRAGQRFDLELTVPANSSATVWLPAKDEQTAREGQAADLRGPGVKLLRMQDGCAVLAVEAGTYRLQSELATGA
jgi:alpha-L-rhamnosidase